MIPDIETRLLRLLRALVTSEAVFEDETCRVLRLDNGTALRRLPVDAATLDAAQRAEVVARSGRRLVLTAAGRARLATRRLEGEVASAAASPSGTAPAPGTPSHVPLVDVAESPLAWLYRRKGQGGTGLIEEVEFLAGERLRADFTRGGMMPSVTTNWRALAAPGGGGAISRADLTDFALAARDRVNRALSALGPELSGIALDVCCFLKGLEDVEGERKWPQRSAKVVLRIALKALARHYGMAGEAVGRAEDGRVNHWGAPDYRPKLR